MATIQPLFPVTAANGLSPVRLWVFPGQGSQVVGMGQALYDSSSSYRQAFDRGHEALMTREGVDLRKLVFEGPKDELTRTLHAQPALLVSNYAFLEHLRLEEGVGPRPGDLMAGHSLGEWTAYVASGALTIEQGALAVYWRGRLMEAAFPFDPATRPMTAVLGLADEAVIAGCAQVHRDDYVVRAANFNAPGQVIISGHPAAVAEAAELLKKQGARLNNDFPVAGPFHTPILAEAREKLGVKIRDDLKIEFQRPQFQIISNFTGREIASDADHLRSLLDQLTGSVRWSASMLRAWELGAVQMVSVDVSGKVLQAFAGKIFSYAAPVQTVDPTIAMHRHALRAPAGAIRTTTFAPAPEVATRRLLEFSYNATEIVREIQKLLERGDLREALAILDNRYDIARDAGMRALRKVGDRPEVIEAMRVHGFAKEDGSLVWPDAVVRDLPTHELPEQAVAELISGGKNSLFAQLLALNLSPIDPEDLVYYAASRWAGEEKRIAKILKDLRYLISKGNSKEKPWLQLMKYVDASGEEQKGIEGWEKVVLYIDTGLIETEELDEKGKKKKIPFFPHPGALTQGDIS